MSKDIDPFEDDIQEEDSPTTSTNQFGMGSIRQALSRWWIILIFGILGYVGALYYMSIAPPKSEAVALLEVDLKTHQLMGAELESDRLGADVVLATEASKLTGPGILAAVAESPEVQALKECVPPEFSWKPRYWRTPEELEAKPASAIPTYDLVGMLAGWIEVSGRRNTSLIEVKVTHPDPESARVIADTLLRVYMEKEQGLKKGGASEAYSILKDESEVALKDLQDAERSLQVYVSALKLNEGIQENRIDLIVMRQRYKPKHPKMIQAEAVYQDIYVRFRREIKRATQNELEQGFWLEYKAEMDALDEQIQANNEGSPKALDEWLALVQNALSSRASRLNARVSHQQQRYQSITQRMTEINVADENNDSDIRIVEAAFIGKTTESVRLIYLAAGSVVGLMGGFGVAFLLGLIDYKIYDVRSVEEATGMHCLAAIPESTLFLRSTKGWESIFTRDPNSANAEAIRNLRASVILLGKKDRHKTLLITSAIPGEGKTTTVAELAMAFALNKEKTLLLDFDLRRPRISEYFSELKGAAGVVDVLAGQKELSQVIQPSELENLSLIGSGSKAPNPAELLHEGELVEILKELAPQFDRIIIDSAPILPVSDSRLLAKHVQSVILVVRARKAPVGAVLRARDLIEEGEGGIAGVVLNGMKKSAGAAGYYGYKGYGEYGAEGGYGYHGEDE